MKTRFLIEADTYTMRVTLQVTQGMHVKYVKEFPTVTDAAQWLLDSIGKAMETTQPSKLETLY